jgi:hypothetical protein
VQLLREYLELGVDLLVGGRLVAPQNGVVVLTRVAPKVEDGLGVHHAPRWTDFLLSFLCLLGAAAECTAFSGFLTR